MPVTLREYREALRLTQGEVAKRAGTTAAYISQIESGNVKLPNAELRRAISGRFERCVWSWVQLPSSVLENGSPF